MKPLIKPIKLVAPHPHVTKEQIYNSNNAFYTIIKEQWTRRYERLI